MTDGSFPSALSYDDLAKVKVRIVAIAIALFVFLSVPLFVETSGAIGPNYIIFPINPWASSPASIIKGPDGNTWFNGTVYSGGHRIAMITTSGVITEYPVAAAPGQMLSGPDGNIWFTAGTLGLGRMALTGTMTLIPLSTNTVSPRAITFGSDGNIWATDAYTNQILRINLSGQVAGMFPIPRSDPYGASGIIQGMDGNVWFTESTTKTVGYVTISGIMTVFDVPKYVGGGIPSGGITVGPDGNIWVTDGCLYEAGCYPGWGKVTADGSFTDYSTIGDNRYTLEIAAGTDGNLWSFRRSPYCCGLIMKLARITTGGVMTDFDLPPYDPFTCVYPYRNIASAGGGNIWFARQCDGYLVRFNPREVPFNIYLPLIVR